MSLVADGPETSTIGRPARALGSSAAISSGTVSTIASAPDDADVQVGDEAQRSAALAGAAVEGDRARLGAAGRAGRQRTVERVELARGERLVLDELEPVRAGASASRSAAIADAPRACGGEGRRPPPPADRR